VDIVVIAVNYQWKLGILLSVVMNFISLQGGAPVPGPVKDYDWV